MTVGKVAVKVYMKRMLFSMLFLCTFAVLSAQFTYGVTGLLHAPSAEMQKHKTVMLGGNFLNKELTSSHWDYHTYNYYLNVTFFPWMEVAYVCTMLKIKMAGEEKLRNQDRHFALRIRAWKEGWLWKHMPAVVFGTSDPYTSGGGGIGTVGSNRGGNGFHSRFFVAATKHLNIGKEEIGVHLSYLYNNRKDYKLNGVAAGLSYEPTFAPHLRLIAEYDSKDFAVGASYLLFGHFLAQVEMQRLKYCTAGITYRFCVK